MIGQTAFVYGPFPEAVGGVKVQVEGALKQ